MKIIFRLIFLITVTVVLSSCSSSTEYEEVPIEKTETNENNPEVIYSEENGHRILTQAQIEQQNKMYHPDVDSTYLYWLGNKLILLYNTTKCNVYALNTLQKSGFKTPKVNALCRDLFDTTRFNDIFPYVPITDLSEIRKGDLVIWKGHVIIFDYLLPPNKQNRVFAKAWWAGTSKQDDGETVINNVIYAKYELKGNFVVRRPLKN